MHLINQFDVDFCRGYCEKIQPLVWFQDEPGVRIRCRYLLLNQTLLALIHNK